MNQARWKSRWRPGIAVAAMMTLAILAYVQIGDRSTKGSPSDIRALRQRDDINVLFILIDTLRSDRLGAYGYHRDTSPNLDRLAAEGVRFARHLSQSSWTKCSMASLWTGLYPARTGVLRYSHVISPEAEMPAEIFREAGYRTVAIWRNGWVAPNFGFSQGFEFYTSPRPSPLSPNFRQENPGIKLVGSDADVMFSAVEFLRTVEREERWFLYLHLMDVHQYASDIESARFGTTYSDIYDNSIHWVDRHIGTLLGVLGEKEALEKTLIIVASDHGEAFGEHGLEGHARNLYGEVTETPWILRFPFRLKPGIVVESPTANVDIWPTVFEILGMRTPSEVDGESALPAIEAAGRRDGFDSRERTQFSYLDGTWGRADMEPRPIVAIDEGGLRAILQVGETERFELFDRTEDPREQNNLADEQPEDAKRLREKIDAHRATATPPWSMAVPEVELDDMMLNQLRALGYRID